MTPQRRTLLLRTWTKAFRLISNGTKIPWDLHGRDQFPGEGSTASGGRMYRERTGEFRESPTAAA